MDQYPAADTETWPPRDDNNREQTNRRRSPGQNDRRGRGGRNRSRSPVPIDRYQPGRRDEYYPNPRRDEYRRRSPPPSSAQNIDRYVPGQEPPALPAINHMANPMAMDNQVGFTYFAEWWRKDQEVKDDRERQKQGLRRPPERLKGEREVREDREKEREKIQAAYDSYKEKFQVQQAKAFVFQHKDEEWFKEKYDPSLRDQFRQRQAEFRRGNYAQWQTDVESGVFDDFTLEGIYKSESNGAGGIIEKEEGETTAAAEVLGVGDLVPSKGGDLRDEAANQPALLVKTIAPHVSRDKMEAFCKEHLGEGDGGFRWLSLSDPNVTKKCHRIGWVLLNEAGEDSENIPMADRGDGRDEEGEDDTKDDNMDTTASPTGPKSVTEKAVESINSKSIFIDEDRGSFTCHVGVHVPPSLPRKKALWDLFAAPERIERDLQLCERLVSKLEQELGEDINGVTKVEERVEELRSKGALQPVNAGTSNGSTKPAKLPNDDIKDEDEDGELDDDDEEGAWDEETDDEELLVRKKKLDLLVEYLRRVFNFCFFCVFESDSVHELSRKCPGGHLRRPRASLTTSAKAAAKASAYGEEFPLKRQNGSDEPMNEDGSPVVEKQQRFQRNNKAHQQLQRAFNWVKTFEDKLFQILEPESIDLKKLGGRNLEEAVTEELKKFVKQEDEAKFRCRVPDCTKLFKGDVFWRKHVEKRHDEWYEKLRQELNSINLYVLDPAHITPARDDNRMGGFRGPFQPGMPMPMPSTGFPTQFGQYATTMPGFVTNGLGGDSNGQLGPMRRGGGRFNNNRVGGPYDRQNKDNRMRPGGGDRSRAMSGTMRFPDAVPGGVVGPREAVAGRSLKSYEDLDAVGGEGDGALDY